MGSIRNPYILLTDGQYYDICSDELYYRLIAVKYSYLIILSHSYLLLAVGIRVTHETVSIKLMIGSKFYKIAIWNNLNAKGNG